MILNPLTIAVLMAGKSQPEKTIQPHYLRGVEAIDTSRLTDIPLFYRPSLKRWTEEPIGPEEASDMIARGEWHPDDVVIDLTRLDPWDRWRQAWARIGAQVWLDADDERGFLAFCAERDRDSLPEAPTELNVEGWSPCCS